MDTANDIRVDKKKEVGVITFNRPHMMNILGTDILKKLEDALTDLGNDRQIKAVIVTGTTHFCAGADIKELKGKDPETAEIFSRLGHRICNQIEDMGKPVIAGVEGYALGAGCEIALACDIRIAAENAKFGQPEINLGLIPGFGATQRLPRLIGIGRAKELILTGRFVDAKEAATIGLVNKMVKNEDLMAKTEEMGQTMARKSPAAMKMAKTLLRGDHDMQRLLNLEITYLSRCFATEDHLEGINAFLEKRTPKFKGI
jgi:enoyl-CoA hydratase